MAKGQKGLEWPSPIYKPRLHIYNTNPTSTQQIKGPHNKHISRLLWFYQTDKMIFLWIIYEIIFYESFMKWINDFIKQMTDMSKIEVS